MEVRSSRRMRTLVTRSPVETCAAKEIARALIPMMARSTTRSNQRPDTLMQDRSPPDRRSLLRRTAGPYIFALVGNFIPSSRHQFCCALVISTAELSRKLAAFLRELPVLSRRFYWPCSPNQAKDIMLPLISAVQADHGP